VVATGSGVWGARSNVARWVFALSPLTLIIIYPALPNDGRAVAYRIVSVGAFLAVVLGAARAGIRWRAPWWVPLLLAGLILLNVSNIVWLNHSVDAQALSGFLDAAGNLVVLAAAVTLVVRCGRNDFGGVIDTAIVALAVGGLIWDFVVLPNEVSNHRDFAAEFDLFVVVFALAGVLGALVRVSHITGNRSSALWCDRSTSVHKRASNRGNHVSAPETTPSTNVRRIPVAYGNASAYTSPPPPTVSPDSPARPTASSRDRTAT